MIQIKVNGRAFLGFASKKKAAQQQAAQEACVVLGLAPVQIPAADLRQQEGDAPRGTMWPLRMTPGGAQQQQGRGGSGTPLAAPAAPAAPKKVPASPSVIDQIRAAFRPENVLVKSVMKKLVDG